MKEIREIHENVARHKTLMNDEIEYKYIYTTITLSIQEQSCFV
jgi:hypothetical protein